MKKPVSHTTAIMSALPLPSQAAGLPDWIHIVPREIRTRDGRGPYNYTDAAALIRASMSDARVAIDENHSTEHLGPQGLPSPARGYVVEMEERADGIWARVDWTEAGKALMADRAYWAVSPVLMHTKAGDVVRIKSVALTNTPNLCGMTALNMESEMDFLARLAKMLGLDDNAGEDAVLSAIEKMQGHETAAQSAQTALSDLAAALGKPRDAAPEVLLAAAQSVQGDVTVVAALQSELASVAGQLKTMRDASARSAAETYVDNAIKAGRVGVKPLREHYVARHMANPVDVEKEIGAMPILSGVTIDPQTQPPAGVITSLNSEQRTVARMLGVSDEAYLKTLAADAAQKE